MATRKAVGLSFSWAIAFGRSRTRPCLDESTSFLTAVRPEANAFAADSAALSISASVASRGCVRFSTPSSRCCITAIFSPTLWICATKMAVKTFADGVAFGDLYGLLQSERTVMVAELRAAWLRQIKQW